MGYSKISVKNARTHFNRVAGQYRYRYGIDTSAYGVDEMTSPKAIEKALSEMRYDVERQKIEQAVEERERREEEELRQREEMALFEINNIKETISEGLKSVKTHRATLDIEASINTIFSIIDEAIYQHGAIDTVERLRPYAMSADSRLEKLAYAIYDDEYNTNTNYYVRDREGDRGRSKYINDMEQLAADLGVSAPSLLYV